MNEIDRIIETLEKDVVLYCHFLDVLISGKYLTFEYRFAGDDLLYAYVLCKSSFDNINKYLYVNPSADPEICRSGIVSDKKCVVSAETETLERLYGIEDRDYLLRMCAVSLGGGNSEANLETADVSDLDTVLRFYRDFYKTEHANIDKIRQRIARGEYFLYFHQGEPVGIIHDFIDNRYCSYITTVYIRPEKRGMKLGRAMLEEYMGRKNGLIVLDVERNNRAFDLYRKAGFEVHNNQSYVTM